MNSQDENVVSATKAGREKNPYRKYLALFIAVTFGFMWGMVFLFILFEEWLTPVFGELTQFNPLVLIALNLPSVVGLFIYVLYDGFGGLKRYLKTLIPRKKDIFWFPVIIVVMSIFAISIRLLSMLFGVDVPQMISPVQMLLLFLRNFYEEVGMLGTMFGYFGFLLPYLQRSYKSNVIAGLLTGFIMGMFLAPGSAFSDDTSLLLYILQWMLLSVCVSYVLCDTRCNVLFFLVTFWIACSGSRLQLYYWTTSTQIIQNSLLVLVWVALHFVFKYRNKDKPLHERLPIFPDFIEQGVAAN